jgi:hypothetical protein
MRTTVHTGPGPTARCEQVVSGANKISVHLHSAAPAVVGLAKSTGCLHPAEALLDSFAYPLTDRITRMTRGARIERRASGAREILRHVRGDLEFPTRCDELMGIMTFVPAQGDSAAAVMNIGNVRLDLVLSRIALHDEKIDSPHSFPFGLLYHRWFKPIPSGVQITLRSRSDATSSALSPNSSA